MLKSTIIILLLIFVEFHSQPIIIDHTCTDVTLIPEYWVGEAKKLIIQSVGESHSTQITNGLRILAEQDSRFSVEIRANIEDFTSNNILRVLNGQRGTSPRTYVGEEDYWATDAARNITENHVNYAAGYGRPLSASIFLWCWDIARDNFCYDESNVYKTFDDELRTTYLNAIARFNSNIPSTRFIYTTSITDSYVDIHGFRVTKYSKDIRNAAIANNGILFDQADIENWSLDNSERRIDFWNEDTLYLRHPDYNEHTGIGFSGDHTNDTLCLRKAKAFWWMLARIAGWDGISLFPVELTSFTAKEENKKVILNWQTETEENNYGFEVERNTPLNPLSRGDNAVNPLSRGDDSNPLVRGDNAANPLLRGDERGVWEAIGFVGGAGNSNSPKLYSFIDENPFGGNPSAVKVQYRLKQVNLDGSFEYYPCKAEVNFNISGVHKEHLSKKFNLFQNYPNPFNPETIISYQINPSDISYGKTSVKVVLRIYDLLGKEIAVLVNKEQNAGIYNVRYDGKKLSSGIYLYKLEAGEFFEVKKMIVSK